MERQFENSATMRELVSSFDWSTTPLGPVESWPQSLRTVVGILLSSRYAMWMAWGPELTFLYNDTYGQVTLGKKHPWALGKPARQVWKEIWPEIGPRIQKVLDTGQSTWDEGLLLFLERSGYSEETYHTFSYSPLEDDDGKISGMLCVVTEESDRVIGERRLKFLRLLASELGRSINEAEVLRSIERILNQNDKDLPFVLVYLQDEDGYSRLATASGLTAGDPAAPMSILPDEADAVWPAQKSLSTRSCSGGGIEEPFPRTAEGSLERISRPRKDGSLSPTEARIAVRVPCGGAQSVSTSRYGLRRFRRPDRGPDRRWHL